MGYKGYVEVVSTDERVSEFYQDLTKNIFSLNINEYLLICENGEVVDRYKWTGSEYVPLSYKNLDNKFTGKVSPRNEQQKLAFDLLQDNKSKIKVIDGGYGTGKDFCMINHALHLIEKGKFKKILWVRNNIEVKNTKPIGYLPGSQNQKLMPYALILADHLGGIDGLERMMNNDTIEIAHLGLLRGRSIRDTIIYCSEAENLTRSHVQLLIGRVDEGSELWMNGDYRQADAKEFEEDNGLKAAIERLKGDPLFGYVHLEKVERSAVARLADKLD